VAGKGNLDGTYRLLEVKTAKEDEACVDGCIYSKDGAPGDRYCFAAVSMELGAEVWCQRGDTGEVECKGGLGPSFILRNGNTEDHPGP